LAILFHFFLISGVPGCKNIQRLAHVYAGNAPEGRVFRFRDGGSAVFYRFSIGDDPAPNTFLFFYGGFGCSSWKYVMPGYVDGLAVPARVYVLNKRFVGDRGTGMVACGRSFDLLNLPEQWVSDYVEFVRATLSRERQRPDNVVLVGVSEGGMVAVKVAAKLSEVTHIALIGDGGYPMRRILETLYRKHALPCNVEEGWKRIVADPDSLEKRWCGSPYRYWSAVMDIDPVPDFLKLEIPIFVGIGERDQNVPLESIRYLESRFKMAGKKNLTVKVYPGANHFLRARGKNDRILFFRELSSLLR